MIAVCKTISNKSPLEINKILSLLRTKKGKKNQIKPQTKKPHKHCISVLVALHRKVIIG